MPSVLLARVQYLVLVAAPLFGCVASIEGELPPDGVAGSPNSGGAAGTGTGGVAAQAAPLARERLHRLNRLEYDNTVRDLLGTSLAPAATFPPDASLSGFDNLADGLSLSPALLDLYSSAARDLAEAALRVGPRYRARFEAKALGMSPGYGFGASAFALAGTTLTAKLSLPQAERVTITVLAGGTFSQAPMPTLDVQVDAQPAQSFVVEALPASPAVYTVNAELLAGEHTIGVNSANFVNQPGDNITNQLVVSYIDAQSDAEVVPATRARVYTCDPAKMADPAACYESIVTGFAERAYRRPLAAAERQSVVELWRGLRVKEGDDEAVTLVVRSLLASASFLYRPSFSLPNASADSAGLLSLDDYTIASRLSYFLWSSMPDDALFESAKSGALQTEAGLTSAVDRLLADPKAAALQVSFAAQWLNARPLEHIAKDPATYPDFDEPLKQAMGGEVEQFFGAFLGSGLPVQRMLDPGFAFLNDRLARHYGLPLPGSSELVRVTLAPGARAGVLFQGAWLTATSEANRTSPVKRGRFLLERIFCRAVPAPPPDIPAFKEPEPNITVRERLAEHRASKACAGCHNLLDPVGLGFEELDGIGSLRMSEAGAAIDSSGAAPSTADSASADAPFVGARQLVDLLEDDPRFGQCLTHNLYSYALGRPVDSGDAPYFDALIRAQSLQTSLPEVVRAIAHSPAFRRQIATEPPP